MKLVWVPKAEAENEEDNEENDGQDFEVQNADESGEEAEESSGGDDKGAEDRSESSGGEEGPPEGQLVDKSRFHHVLQYAIKKRTSNISNVADTKYDPTDSFAQPASSGSPSPEEDEPIYDDVLEVAQQPVLQLTHRTGNKMAVGAEQLKMAHLPELASSASGTTGECQVAPHSSQTPGAEEMVPPTIPPRVPINQDKVKSGHPVPMPLGIPLPQPTLEEWRAFRSSSPGPQLSIPPPRPPPRPASPLIPQPRGMDPPARSSPDGSSLNSQSASSVLRLKGGHSPGGRVLFQCASLIKGQLCPSCFCCLCSSNIFFDTSLHFFSLLLLSSTDQDSEAGSDEVDTPLYQTYRATVITKEIRMDWGPRKVIAGGAKGGSLKSTLWQDLPEVRESGILERLSPAECSHQESMFEVLTSETSYLRSLHVLTDHFMDSRELSDTLIILDKKRLFSNILRVREVSERFLMDLEKHVDQNVVISDICDIIHYHAQHHFPAYIDYVRNQVYQEKTYTRLMQENPQFAAVITRLQESPQCQRLPFMSFLLLPFQRITRIKMLIENILKRTKEGTKEDMTASKALGSVAKIIDDCNTEVGKMKQMEELIHITNTLDFEKLKAIPIISQNRFLEKRGELQEMAKGGTLFNLRPKFTPIFLFLFNDLLILASKKSLERYVVIDHAHRSLVQVQPVSEQSNNPTLEHCFCLTLLENHQGRMIERLLKAPTQSDMDRWIAAFPHPDHLEKETNEVVYEDWDCPQVHCVEQYVAEQADELSLEPLDIINILRKTNEGELPHGWFPVRYVQEITNEHVRRRNLRERYRVIQAAHAATKSWTSS
uniref:Rho guanine nucleotide exchange factor 15b n=1 Tax=Scleropages formosus TaxID=113540 RepID=A0A8C9SQA2_SCLFO